MPRTTRARPRGTADYWPGFVDALATLLLVIIFLLAIFMLSQFFLSQALTGRDEALTRLNARLAALAEELDLAKGANEDLTTQLARLSATLETETERADKAEGRAAALSTALEESEDLNTENIDQIALLNQQLAALREQMAALQASLDASEERDKEQKAVIADLGKRLNAALAQKVQELNKARSEFFGKLREVLGDRSDIEIVGDRFVFQSEVLFASGSADINEAGKDSLRKVASALKEIATSIPDDVNWVLRVDGHSDRQPINTADFKSNWELSSARAIAVVRFFIAEGVPAKRLVAAGFGEFQPLAKGSTAEAYKRNRRIELKLTQR